VLELKEEKSTRKERGGSFKAVRDKRSTPRCVYPYLDPNQRVMRRGTRQQTVASSLQAADGRQQPSHTPGSAPPW
jgi:hypothetical protein